MHLHLQNLPMPSTLILPTFPSGLSQDVQHWIAQAIGGAMNADKKKTPQDPNLLAQITNDLGGGEDIRQIIESAIHTENTGMLSPIQLPDSLAKTIFRYLLVLCILDRNLATEEIHYINNIGKLLNIEAVEKRQIFKQTIFHEKERFFHQLMDQLSAEERFWLAIMILKVIYADEQVHQKELPYFNNVVELLKDTGHSIKSVKQESTHQPIEAFQQIHLSEEASHWVLEYLLGIVMIDQDCTDEELDNIRKIAKLLQYNHEKLEELIATAKSDHQFLFA